MELFFIRHSMTAGNALRRYIGATDEPLSEEGIALAEATKYPYSPRNVYVTPYRRTAQTAAILFPQAQQIPVDALKEMNFGIFENRSAEEMKNDAAYRAWVVGGCTDVCPEGESKAAFSERVCRGFLQCLTEEAQQVFVVHGGTVMAILEAFGEPKRDYYSYALPNCKGYRCQWHPESKTLTDIEKIGE